MIGHIYNLVYDGIIFYVGSTCNIETRIASHRTHFGYNTEIEIIETVEVKQIWDLRKIEIYWINQFKQWGFSLKNKDVPISYNNAPADVVEYILSLHEKKDNGVQMTMKLFTQMTWDIIKEHKENSEKK